MRLALVALIALLACGKREEGRGKGVVDVILRGGWIIDGSGNPRYQGDVAITGDRIAGVGFLNGAAARETVDVSGLAAAPGFIDMMGQSEINVLIDNRVLSKVTQGITTEVTGEGGSVAPLTDQLVLDDSDAMKKWHYREDWRDLDGYFAQLAKQGSTVNIATFVGATQVRLAVVGKENRAPTGPELAHMTALVDTLMEQGALGLWTALEYAPASYSTTDEIIALAKAARRHGGIYASHMRNEGIRIETTRWTRCSASRAKPTFRRRSHTSRCRAVRAGVACPGCSRGSIRPGPWDSTSRPTNTRTRARRRRSTPRSRPGPRAVAGTPCSPGCAIP
ncbi:MAG: hypothetical protein DMD65_04340 [Gemmatimonadetes bacterium]|nr:MAG: hypothetical protein DMD65_04340 [Gemmatimonadota bacterium]